MIEWKYSRTVSGVGGFRITGKGASLFVTEKDIEGMAKYLGISTEKSTKDKIRRYERGMQKIYEQQLQLYKKMLADIDLIVKYFQERKDTKDEFTQKMDDWTEGCCEKCDPMKKVMCFINNRACPVLVAVRHGQKRKV
jgi:hypothetical protein